MEVGSVNHWYDVAFGLIDEISNMDHEYALSNRKMLLKKLILSMKTEFVVDFLRKNVAFQTDEIATKDTAITEDQMLRMTGDVIDKQLCERGHLHLTYKDIKEELLKRVEEGIFNEFLLHVMPLRFLAFANLSIHVLSSITCCNITPIN